jgi:Raffinose synthase or seed imbibition protein Sip1
VAAVGLVNMLNTGGAVLEASGSPVGGGGGGLSASLRGAGRMLVYASTRPARVALDGADVAFEYQQGEGAVRFDVPASAGLRTQLRVEL